jgi:hypothetical protein
MKHLLYVESKNETAARACPVVTGVSQLGFDPLCDGNN